MTGAGAGRLARTYQVSSASRMTITITMAMAHAPLHGDIEP